MIGSVELRQYWIYNTSRVLSLWYMCAIFYSNSFHSFIFKLCIMNVHTLKLCTGDADPEQSLLLICDLTSSPIIFLRRRERERAGWFTLILFVYLCLMSHLHGTMGMRGSRMFFPGGISDNVFLWFCHFNGVSLAGGWWPNINCWLGSLVIFQGI